MAEPKADAAVEDPVAYPPHPEPEAVPQPHMLENIEGVLPAVDAALGVKHPPSIEYILVRPFSALRIPGTDIGISYNNYGHSAVRYTLEDGTQKVMNIAGSSGLVSFFTPEEYIFGTNSPQGGITHRDMVSVRVENIPPEAVRAMDEYYQELASQNEKGLAKFNIILGPILNALRFILPRNSLAVRGNCAYWTSSGLEKAGIVTGRSMWPKSIFIDILENAEHTAAASHDNVHVVSYRRDRAATRSYGIDAQPISGVAPFQPIRSFFYFNLESFAHAIVSVPLGSATPEVQLTDDDDRAKPSTLRNVVNSRPVAIASVISSLILIRYALRRLRF
ncbi:uncharacterized protein AMSG_06688 [Thecamonas trahens ATCC 50062]|uniref:Uncharacterized protein n=1 Tax=Thecamonas trahens ATCC 50062 TaxID=461836 RepID=A0A0L0DEY7_THETB|nr:hypothetical protein AMSG_06688 [Thecamonas trahens ATCC 50062]KNC50790.1 hypothetical protein AMSG_06688 [Thecamonas trahens ATCC 50062]|eukprot:XP_013756748.1 hypothetical protein AMSG_06688 [Thecamonas trahens ATCC 50062]